MLADHPIQPVLQATDLGAVRAFYHDVLGLPIVGEGDRHLVFGCGGGTQLAVSKSITGAADTRTQATWVVDDVRAAVAWLRSRGVTVTVPPGLKTEDGIADVGFAWGVWVVDPAGNTMGTAQMKP